MSSSKFRQTAVILHTVKTTDMEKISVQNISLDGPDPAEVLCPNCNSRGPTRVESKSGLGAWLSAGLLCFVGCICGCCLIPLYMDEFKIHKHYCRSCGVLIATGRGDLAC